MGGVGGARGGKQGHRKAEKRQSPDVCRKTRVLGKVKSGTQMQTWSAGGLGMENTSAVPRDSRVAHASSRRPLDNHEGADGVCQRRCQLLSVKASAEEYHLGCQGVEGAWHCRGGQMGMLARGRPGA